ncbi:bh protein [Bacillaceae bacterium Marseille-Q3522]|nr:bh protein [Bacillaceae bacterium Marseille-Q3522]
MKKTVMEADLFCISCKNDVPHKVTYINDKLSEVECKNCHRIVAVPIDPKKEFLKEVYKRVSTKPSRMTEEYKSDLSHFLRSMPKRVISKPYRIMTDLHKARKIIHEYEEDHKN